MGLNIWRHSGFLGKMTVREGMEILGVASLSRAAVYENYRRLLRGNHPDAGGSEYLAQKINEARDILLKQAK
ncbi:DnaJ-like protein subfamily C member 19 [Nematocida minor]|uniref:DnaJ-like protein subfamily C member 19 n=1 Tax=Nematocida minor TaxID=1912983 RepID=UPI002220B477|nr:DnaJ-like protein subfamily C member 19 [Nematocida minor]KAI5191829.1 DnaJ-like protein subfamily C member 19 [Nematocida minor]